MGVRSRYAIETASAALSDALEKIEPMKRGGDSARQAIRPISRIDGEGASSHVR
jgi:hypothetical protein